MLVNAEGGGKPLEVTQGEEQGRPVFQVPVEVPAGGKAKIQLDLLEPPTEGSTGNLRLPSGQARFSDCR